MENIFNIAERFSRELDEVRGSDRRNKYLRRYRSWVKVSPVRRATAVGLGLGLMAGATGLLLFLNRRKIDQMSSKVMEQLREAS